MMKVTYLSLFEVYNRFGDIEVALFDFQRFLGFDKVI
jgi:hypothetical protein